MTGKIGIFIDIYFVDMFILICCCDCYCVLYLPPQGETLVIYD